MAILLYYGLTAALRWICLQQKGFHSKIDVPLVFTFVLLCQTRTAGVVDVVYLNIVTWSVGCERVGERAKGGAVVGRPGTRVDGYSPPRVKKLVLQVSKHRAIGSKGLGWIRHYMICGYCNIWSLNNEISMFRLKINHVWDARDTCV